MDAKNVKGFMNLKYLDLEDAKQMYYLGNLGDLD